MFISGVNDTDEKREKILKFFFSSYFVESFTLSTTPAINLSPVSLTPLNREYLRAFSKKFKTAPMEYLGAWGTLIHEKNLKSKISCQTPFKGL
jgi:hypothetical protein